MLALLDADETTRLVRLLGMLGSAHDGEVLNAARMADRFVRERGLTWSQLILPKPKAAADRPSMASPDGWRALARWILTNVGGELNEKEAQFVSQMTTWRGMPSEKQQAWLKAIAEQFGSQQ
jgi:hypothetical protein